MVLLHLLVSSPHQVPFYLTLALLILINAEEPFIYEKITNDKVPIAAPSVLKITSSVSQRPRLNINCAISIKIEKKREAKIVTQRDVPSSIPS